MADFLWVCYLEGIRSEMVVKARLECIAGSKPASKGWFPANPAQAKNNILREVLHLLAQMSETVR